MHRIIPTLLVGHTLTLTRHVSRFHMVGTAAHGVRHMDMLASPHATRAHACSATASSKRSRVVSIRVRPTLPTFPPFTFPSPLPPPALP